MKWISVKDRLPEKNTTILVKADFKYEIVYEIVEVIEQSDGYIAYLNMCCGDDIRKYKVTYWMPLPKGPNEDKAYM
jgi:hypothetical protein